MAFSSSLLGRNDPRRLRRHQKHLIGNKILFTIAFLSSSTDTAPCTLLRVIKSILLFFSFLDMGMLARYIARKAPDATVRLCILYLLDRLLLDYVKSSSKYSTFDAEFLYQTGQRSFVSTSHQEGPRDCSPLYHFLVETLTALPL